MEVCANSLRSALAAQEGGAVRVELCDNLHEGGTTPSYAQIAMAKRMVDIEVYPLIRPRGGDFLYTDLEFELMKEDIKMCRDLKCEGVVFGILTPKGFIDEKRCSELLALAGDMKVTFNRAFDRCIDLFDCMETIIELGFSRILSSGGQLTADRGAFELARLIEQAEGRISIMPGSGITIDNIEKVIRITKATEFHASSRWAKRSEMEFRSKNLKMEDGLHELDYELTNSDDVKLLIHLANNPRQQVMPNVD